MKIDIIYITTIKNKKNVAFRVDNYYGRWYETHKCTLTAKKGSL